MVIGWLRKRMRIAKLQAELDRLIIQAQEAGAEAGLFGLQDRFTALAEATLKSLYARLVESMGRDPALLSIQMTRLQEQRQAAEKELAGLRNAHDTLPSLTEVCSKARWAVDGRSVISVFLLGGVTGLSLLTHHIRLPWEAWAALILACTLLVLNLGGLAPGLRASCARTSGYLARLWGACKSALITMRIALLRRRIQKEEERRDRAQQWVGRNLELIVGHYEFQKSRGQRAA